MERHGVSAVGADLEHAFVLTDLAEEAARIACFSKFFVNAIGVMPGRRPS